MSKIKKKVGQIGKTEQMEKIEKEILNLKKSPLYSERIKNKVFPVIGEGSFDAKIMFVGEAPGKNEAKTGKPFCGASGRVLDELLDSIKLKREDVYVTNIVKDRPTANRDPSKEEIKIYGPFLDRQIEIIQPKVIATLGRYSAEYIMKKFDLDSKIETIGKMHGKVFETNFFVPINSGSLRRQAPREDRDEVAVVSANLSVMEGDSVAVQSPVSASPVRDKKSETSVISNGARHEAVQKKIKIIPLLHPAVVLYNAFSRSDLKKDFKVLKKF